MVVRRDAGRGLTWYENNAKYEATDGAEIPPVQSGVGG